MRYSTKGWLVVGAVVLAIEAKAPKDDMLSHAFDDWLEHPVGKFLAPAVALTTVAHLLNMLEEAYDPYHRVFAWKK